MNAVFTRGAMRAAAPLLLLALAAPARAQARVEYEADFGNAVHHEARITATFHGVPRGRPLELRMSRTSPGRYALHEFAKNVYGVTATDGAGRPLALTRPNPHQWDAAGHDGTVRVAYTVYGDRTDGTYAGIDATHAHLNIPAAFMWARGMEGAPVRVRFHRPAGWRVATQLFPTADSSVFTAPHLQYFMDSPTEVGPFTLRTWQVAGADGTAKDVRLAIHHLGTEAQADSFAEKVKKVVAEQVALFGGAAAYDGGTYTFIADYLPWANGDGMEHRNSTILTSTRSLATPQEVMGNLGTVSHEFFHSWNVERMRPSALEPFSFERENMSGELWFAEGFTSYYDDLFIRRAGLMTDEQYARGLSGTVDPVVTAPGRRYFSAVEMSMQAPFVDAAVSNDPVNRQNTFISYYTWGAALGLGLDLTLRTRFADVTLDDYMRAVWREFGPQTAGLAPARGYTVADLRRILGEVTRDRAFADDFFRRYVEGREVVDYEALLGRAGFLLRKANPGSAWLGAPLNERDSAVVVESTPVVDSPLYQAGVDRLDRILAVDGARVTTQKAMWEALDARRIGETVEMEIEQRGARRRVRVAVVEGPALQVTTYESAGREVTPAMRELRARWLGSRAGAR